MIMNSKNTFIDYLKHLGADQDQAEHTYNVILNRIADGEGRVEILQELDLPLDLIELLT
jgi:DNA anti-recombination protein RmuC